MENILTINIRALDRTSIDAILMILEEQQIEVPDQTNKKAFEVLQDYRAKNY